MARSVAIGVQLRGLEVAADIDPEWHPDPASPHESCNQDNCGSTVIEKLPSGCTRTSAGALHSHEGLAIRRSRTEYVLYLGHFARFHVLEPPAYQW